MELEPSHIRSQRFKKQTFGGYKPTEVQGFLLNISEAYTQLKLENQSLSERLSEAQETLSRVRGIEEALLQALKQAENQKNEIILQSEKEAEVRVLEGKVAAEALVSTAKQKAQQMLHSVKIEHERKMQQMKQDFDILDESYAEVESHVGKLIAQMQQFVKDTNQQITHLSTIKNRKVAERKLSTAKQILNKKTTTKSTQKPDPAKKESKAEGSLTAHQLPAPNKPRTIHESLQQTQQDPNDMREFFKDIDNS